MALNGQFKAPKVSINMKTFDWASLEFSLQWRFESRSTLKLAIFDLQDAPGNLDKKDSVGNPYFLPFIEKLKF
jgi:hypothetical protein